MANYTRTRIDEVTGFSATASSGGELAENTQYWFVIVPINATYYMSNLVAWGKASSVVSATTTTTDKTITLNWTKSAGAFGYLIYWTTVDPDGNAENFNTTGWQIKSPVNAYTTSVGDDDTFTFDNLRTSGSPYYSMPWNDSYRFVHIFNNYVDLLTITRSFLDEVVTFTDIYNACVTNGWDSIDKIGENTYFVKASMAFQSTFINADFRGVNIITIGGFINAQSGTSTTYFGSQDATTNNQDHCVWLNTFGQGASGHNSNIFRDVVFYNCSFTANRPAFQLASTNYHNIVISGANYKIFNVEFNTVQYLSFQAIAAQGSFCKNVKVYRARWALRFDADSTLADFDNVSSISSNADAYFRLTPVAKGFNVENTQGNFNIIAINSSLANVTTAKLYNSNIDLSNDLAKGRTPYAVYWYNNGFMATGNEYVEGYVTQNFHIKDRSGNPIQAAEITIYDKNGNELNSMMTDANGDATEDVMVGVNKSLPTTANNYGQFLDNNPMTIKIFAPGYREYSEPTEIKQQGERSIVLDAKATIMYVKAT